MSGMSPKKVEALADEWIAGNESVRTRIQHEMRGGTNLNLLITSVGKRVAAPVPEAMLKTA
jgi:hypothetical protein